MIPIVPFLARQLYCVPDLKLLAEFRRYITNDVALSWNIGRQDFDRTTVRILGFTIANFFNTLSDLKERVVVVLIVISHGSFELDNRQG